DALERALELETASIGRVLVEHSLARVPRDPRELLARQFQRVDRVARVPSDEDRSEEHTSELQSRENLVCRLLLEKKNHQLARIHGMWGLGQLARQDQTQAEPLLDLLQDSDAEIRAQAARLLGDVSYTPATDPRIR